MAKSSNEAKVTRIKAKDSGVKREKADSISQAMSGKAEKVATEPTEKRRIGTRIAEYLKGSWHELTLVRWPDRKSTWKMTGALVVFTAFFGVIILLFDYAFQYIFKLLIGK